METITCKNCDFQFDASFKFCPMCSQKADTHRFTWKHLLHEIPHAVFHIDGGFFYTMKMLTVNPGKMIREYIEGKREKYFNPISYLILLLGGLYFLSGIIFPSITPIENEQLSGFQAFLKHYRKVFWIIPVPAMAFSSWLFFKKHKFNFTEHFILNLYIAAQFTLITFVSKLFELANINLLDLSLLLCGIYWFYTLFVFFEKKYVLSFFSVIAGWLFVIIFYTLLGQLWNLF